MLHRELRMRVAQIARLCAVEGLNQGTSGNVSLRDPDTGHVLITPSGVSYEDLGPEHIVVIDVHGNVVDGDLVPSSETPMHTAIYRERHWVHGIVHTHSPYATAFACVGEPLPALHYLIALIGKKIPVADYATYGTPELARQALAVLTHEAKGVLLKNHGVLAAGGSVEEAYRIASTIEYLARIHYLALQIGKPVILSDAEIQRVAEKFTSYGQPARRAASS